jgi:hypothetical protein
MTRPGRLCYIANGVGRPLPESIGDRIRNDLTGPAATSGDPISTAIASDGERRGGPEMGRLTGLLPSSADQPTQRSGKKA